MATDKRQIEDKPPHPLMILFTVPVVLFCILIIYLYEISKAATCKYPNK